MELRDTTGADPNRLPYFVTDSAGNRVLVVFAPLSAADSAELSGADWLGSVFREAWIAFCGAPRTLKLVEVGTSAPILGLLRLGVVKEGDPYLRDSLLETTPALRFHPNSIAPLRGVGRILVARLVVESYNEGAKGALLVKARTPSFGFYRHLGFVASSDSVSYHVLSAAQAAALFEEGTQ